jgi:hypothetical protein
MLQDNCDPIDVILRKLINSFRSRVLKSENLIVCSVVESMHFRSSMLNQRWSKVLYSLSS